MNTEENKVVVLPVDKSKSRHVIKVALILFVVTVIEFIIAFTVGPGGLRTSITNGAFVWWFFMKSR